MELFLNRPTRIQPDSKHEFGVIYEHLKVASNQLEIAGEHIMSGADALQICPDFFGADEAITNYTTGRDDWVATLIVTEKTMEAAWDRRNSVIADIKKAFKIDRFRDSAPQDYT